MAAPGNRAPKPGGFPKGVKLDHYLDAETHQRVGTLARAFGMTRKDVINQCLQHGLAAGEVTAVARLIAADHHVAFEVTPSEIVTFNSPSPESKAAAEAEYEAMAERLRGIDNNREYAGELSVFVFKRTDKRARDEQVRRLF